MYEVKVKKKKTLMYRTQSEIKSSKFLYFNTNALKKVYT